MTFELILLFHSYVYLRTSCRWWGDDVCRLIVRKHWL